MSNRIKCDICKKRRVPGQGKYEILFGTHFHVTIEPCSCMCGQCRDSILRAAFYSATEKYKELRRK